MTEKYFFNQLFRSLTAYQIDDLIKGNSAPVRFFIQDYDNRWHFHDELNYLDINTANHFAKLKDCYRLKFALYIDNIGEEI